MPKVAGRVPGALPYTGDVGGFSTTFSTEALAGLLLIILGLLTRQFAHPVAEATPADTPGSAALSYSVNRAENVNVVRGVVALVGLLLIGGFTRRFTSRK